MQGAEARTRSRAERAPYADRDQALVPGALALTTPMETHMTEFEDGTADSLVRTAS